MKKTICAILALSLLVIGTSAKAEEKTYIHKNCVVVTGKDDLSFGAYCPTNPPGNGIIGFRSSEYFQENRDKREKVTSIFYIKDGVAVEIDPDKLNDRLNGALYKLPKKD